VLSAGRVAIALVAAVVIGMSKVAVPGAGLLATPLVALTFSGREISGATLGILVVSDVAAVRLVGRGARWDLLRVLAPGVAIGYAAGAWFYIAARKSNRTIDIVVATLILVVVVLQVIRLVRRKPASDVSRGVAGFYGASGGFATFVSNNAGPILNGYLTSVGLEKDEFIGTSAWFYFIVNLAKLPIYLALDRWSHSSSAFFSRTSLAFDLVALPGLALGMWVGLRLYRRIDQRTFILVVLALSALGAVKLLAG
jgi:uncharacterized membrane protein YfcA